MPSFDIVSEIPWQELRNAVANAQREVANRWDFCQVATSIELNEKAETVKVATESDFQLQQLLDITYDQLSKRGIERSACTLPQQPTHSGKLWSFEITFKQGIAGPLNFDYERYSTEALLPKVSRGIGTLSLLIFQLFCSIDTLLAKKIVKLIKAECPKAQSHIQDQQVRVIDKSRNTLQAVMTLLRQAELEQPLQFTNFRD